jgi:hypothetical protein
MYNLTCKELSWLFYSGQGRGQTVGRKEDRRRNEERMRSEATAICQQVDRKAKTTKNDQTTNHQHTCTLSILIMTNTIRPVAFDGHLMENRGRKQKFVN